jgi:hypothetical protein
MRSLSFAISIVVVLGKRSWDVALLLPFRSNKERQTAAKQDTKRRSKIGGFYEGMKRDPATSSKPPQRPANVSFSASPETARKD